MLSHKHIRQKGKFSLMRFFQKFKEGDKVAVAKELSFPFPYSHRLQGRTGTVINQRGKVYEVEIKGHIRVPPSLSCTSKGLCPFCRRKSSHGRLS